ncbi:MAG: RluA family pseudouridine synthase [Dongiaceae bacterium]
MSGVRHLPVSTDEAELRLDRWFRRRFPDLNHGRLEKLLRTGQVRVDGHRARANQRVISGQTIRVPPYSAEPRIAPRAASPQASAREIKELARLVLYRDEDLLAINKPPGLAVQGGTGLRRHLDAMLDALRFDASERPRLVHRLDRDTSGVLLLARNARSAAKISEAFRDKTTRKIYWAIVIGIPKPTRGRIDLALAKLPGRAGERMAPDEDGKSAITDYQLVDRAGKTASLLELKPITGRTHQLRAHCAALGTPILGDGKYGGAKAFLPGPEMSQLLHLHARSIELPGSSGGMLRIVAPLPPHMKKSCEFLGLVPKSDADVRDDE